jgi:hypothetical protein
LTFSLPWVKRKEIIKIQKPIIAVEKMGVTEEGISMSDESKKKAGLPDKKVKGLFCFERD